MKSLQTGSTKGLHSTLVKHTISTGERNLSPRTDWIPFCRFPSNSNQTQSFDIRKYKISISLKASEEKENHATHEKEVYGSKHTYNTFDKSFIHTLKMNIFLAMSRFPPFGPVKNGQKSWQLELPTVKLKMENGFLSWKILIHITRHWLEGVAQSSNLRIKRQPCSKYWSASWCYLAFVRIDKTRSKSLELYNCNRKTQMSCPLNLTSFIVEQVRPCKLLAYGKPTKWWLQVNGILLLPRLNRNFKLTPNMLSATNKQQTWSINTVKTKVQLLSLETFTEESSHHGGHNSHLYEVQFPLVSTDNFQTFRNNCMA